MAVLRRRPIVSSFSEQQFPLGCGMGVKNAATSCKALDGCYGVPLCVHRVLYTD